MKGKGTKERKREFNRKYNSTLEERIKKTPKIPLEEIGPVIEENLGKYLQTKV